MGFKASKNGAVWEAVATEAVFLELEYLWNFEKNYKIPRAINTSLSKYIVFGLKNFFRKNTIYILLLPIVTSFWQARIIIYARNNSILLGFPAL